MESQTIAVASQQLEPAIQLTTAVWAARRGPFRRADASIVLGPACRLTRYKTVEGLRVAGRVSARAYAAAGACILFLFMGTIEGGRCGESQAPAFTATTGMGYKLPEPNVIRGRSGLVTQVAEITAIELKPVFERAHGEIGNLVAQLAPVPQSDAGYGKTAQPSQSVPDMERQQALEREREWGKADALTRALTSKVRAELDAVRSTAEAAEIKQRRALSADMLARELSTLQSELETARAISREAVQAGEAGIKQTQALERERDRADNLARELASVRPELEATRAVAAAGPEAAQAAAATAEQELKQQRDKAEALGRELTSLRTELDAGRIAGAEAAQAAEAEIKQKQALEQERNQERDRADALARELASLRADLDKARIAGAEVAQAAEAEVKQKQALEQERNQERDRADALVHELTSVGADLDMARAAAAQTAQAAKIEQEQALGKERDKTETLARELAAARKEADARSARLAATYAEILQMTERNRAIAAGQKLALASERDRADALARKLTSARDELEAGKRQIAALTALRALPSRESAVDRSQERTAGFSSSTIEAKGRSPEQTSGKAVTSTSGLSSASRPEAPSATREAASDVVPKVAMGTEQSKSASAPHPSLVDEQRLLARANALLGQANISGARSLLQHALERGSARAAFMLAETYDARILQSWRASGISGDRTKARELYERAQAGGIEDAKERIETLK